MARVQRERDTRLEQAIQGFERRTEAFQQQTAAVQQEMQSMRQKIADLSWDFLEFLTREDRRSDGA